MIMPSRSKKTPIINVRKLRYLERVRIDRIRDRHYAADEIPYPISSQ